MSNVIYGNMVGGGAAPLKTLILTDENGNEVVGVVTESVQMFDATPADVKIGKTFVSDDGCLEGTDTKTYRVRHGAQLILPGKAFTVPIKEYDGYDYTNFQAIVSLFNTSITDSTATNKVVLYDAIYNVNSDSKVADVVKNTDTKSIDFNFINDTNNVYVIHFNTYKEE